MLNQQNLKDALKLTIDTRYLQLSNELPQIAELIRETKDNSQRSYRAPVRFSEAHAHTALGCLHHIRILGQLAEHILDDLGKLAEAEDELPRE